LLAGLLSLELSERALRPLTTTTAYKLTHTHSHTVTIAATVAQHTHNEPHMCATVYNSLGGALSDTTATTAVLECVWLHSDPQLTARWCSRHGPSHRASSTAPSLHQHPIITRMYLPSLPRIHAAHVMLFSLTYPMCTICTYMDEWTNGWTDGRPDGWVDGCS
jgi:hypothetical protein